MMSAPDQRITLVRHTPSCRRLGRAYSIAAVATILVASAAGADPGAIRYVGKTKYLNNARAVATHTIDDSTKYVANCIDAIDKYGIKATIFVSTEQAPAP